MTKASKHPRLLFLENRGMTHLWSAISHELSDKIDCTLFRFTRVYGRGFHGRLVSIDSSLQSPVDECIDIDGLVQLLCQTDRSVYLYGNSTDRVRKTVGDVVRTLDTLKIDAVFGEVTSVYERIVEHYCRVKRIPFLAPMTCRIPIDRFFFLDGARLVPLEIHSRTNAPGAVHVTGESGFTAGRNDLRMLGTRLLRFRSVFETFAGWVFGERMHSPSPWRRLSLLIAQAKAARHLRSSVHPLAEIDKHSVVYCLHVQPESTLDTYSPDYSDQGALLVQMRKICDSAARPLYVRLHPRAKNEEHLYFEELEHLRVLDPRIPMGDIFARHPTIVSVSGTVLIEAASAGIRAIALDDTYLATFPGVEQVPIAGLGDALAVGNVAPASKDEQTAWFDRLNRFSHPGIIAPPEWGDSSDRKNVQNIAGSGGACSLRSHLSVTNAPLL